MIRLYNTMTSQNQEVESKGPVTIYTCGPTVYLDPQIGNWRTFIFYDTLVRVLKLADYDTKHVMNITDVGHLVSDGDTGEDKMSKTAKLQRKTAWEVAESYTKLFFAGMADLNMLNPTKVPKATDNIPEQIAMVEAIEAAGLAYTIKDGVYFDTSKLDDYGKLAGGSSADDDFARINKNDQKKNPEDFALWKLSAKGEQRDMEWESPWGIGFPGWHLECSAMSKKFLGDTIDIHAGGIDHIPVHHTNEIAQSETANGAEFARIWMHGEFMKVDGTKMSKSLGNSYTLQDIYKKGFTALDFRLMVVQGHYRTETNFTWDNLQAAANRLLNLRNAAALRWQLSDDEENLSETFKQLHAEALKGLYDDLNTPIALEAIGKAISAVENGLNAQSARSFIGILQLADKALGLELLNSTPDISDMQKTILEKRQKARNEGDYDESDRLRDELLESGVAILDHHNRQTWRFIK